MKPAWCLWICRNRHGCTAHLPGHSLRSLQNPERGRGSTLVLAAFERGNWELPPACSSCRQLSARAGGDWSRRGLGREVMPELLGRRLLLQTRRDVLHRCCEVRSWRGAGRQRCQRSLLCSEGPKQQQRSGEPQVVTALAESGLENAFCNPLLVAQLQSQKG